mmetsp:Transcript_93850/g.223188  ORF Transcript_93850/g.223188 Transcript_93850/m.223188 type:complete len:132 (-) Transcript_93850:7-402(-)
MMSPAMVRTGTPTAMVCPRRSKGIPKAAAFRRIFLPGDTGETGDPQFEVGESVGDTQPGSLTNTVCACGDAGVPRSFGLANAREGNMLGDDGSFSGNKERARAFPDTLEAAIAMAAMIQNSRTAGSFEGHS